MFKLKKDVVFDQVGNESLVHMPSGSSLALNRTGTVFLNAAIENDVEKAVCMVSSEYCIPEERVRLDAADFIADILAKGVLIECEA